MLRVAGALLFFVAVQSLPAASPSLTVEQQKLLKDLRTYAAEYSQRLPNFICTQITSRDVTLISEAYRDQVGGRQEFGPSDQITEKVTFFNQKERYEVVAVNGRNTKGIEHDKLAGAVSIGEFGSMLREVFDPQSHAVFRAHRMTSIRGRRAYVFGYQVPKEAGTAVTDRTTNQKVVSSYSGLVFVDAETSQVVRITSHMDLPKDFPIEQTDRLVDYRSTDIAGKNYNLPFRSELRMQRGLYLYVNKIDFRDYRKFAVEATIRLGDFADLEAPGAAPSAGDATATPVANSVGNAPQPVVAASETNKAEVDAAQPPDQAETTATEPPRQLHTEPAAAQVSVIPSPASTAAVAKSEAPATPTPTSDPAADSSFRLQLRSDLVLIPVVVRDAAGKSIGNLAQEDFAILDKGKRQEISSFTVETAAVPSEVVKAGDSAKGTFPADQGQGAAPAATTYTVYFFDDTHIDAEELSHAREAALRSINELDPQTRLAIITVSGMVQQSFTGDREKLKDALLKLRAQTIASAEQECPTITYFMADQILAGMGPPMAAATQETIVCQSLNSEEAKVAPKIVMNAAMRVAEEGERNTRSALLQLRNVVRWISKAPGKREIVMISPGFVVSNTARRDEVNVMDEAIRSEVFISALDTSGVSTLNPAGSADEKSYGAALSRMKLDIGGDEEIAKAGALEEIAEGTGGSLVRNTNDLYAGLRHLETRPDYTYILGFRPSHLKSDGSFHSLTVKVNNRGKLDVHTRRGYFAPKD